MLTKYVLKYMELDSVSFSLKCIQFKMSPLGKSGKKAAEQQRAALPLWAREPPVKSPVAAAKCNLPNAYCTDDWLDLDAQKKESEVIVGFSPL